MEASPTRKVILNVKLRAGKPSLIYLNTPGRRGDAENLLTFTLFRGPETF